MPRESSGWAAWVVERAPCGLFWLASEVWEGEVPVSGAKTSRAGGLQIAILLFGVQLWTWVCMGTAGHSGAGWQAGRTWFNVTLQRSDGMGFAVRFTAACDVRLQ